MRLGHPTDVSHAAENVVNGVNLTTNASFMWRAAKPDLNSSSKEKKKIALIFQFEFDRTVELKGLRLWNYNEGREESTCGIKACEIYVDWILRCSTVVRKAPGEFLGKFDYAQFLSLVGTKPEPDMLSRSAKGSPGSSGNGGTGFGSTPLDLRSPVRNEGFSPDNSEDSPPYRPSHTSSHKPSHLPTSMILSSPLPHYLSHSLPPTTSVLSLTHTPPHNKKSPHLQKVSPFTLQKVTPF